MNAKTIKIDVIYFKHLLECLRHQKSITTQPLNVQAEWQSKIDITLEQSIKLLNKKLEELREKPEDFEIDPSLLLSDEFEELIVLDEE